MVTHFDHVTIVVRDLEAAKRFFTLLGFDHDHSVVISGETVSSYMGVPGLEADHVTLVLPGAVPRLEVQLLRYRRPDPIPDPNVAHLQKVGFNHVCFAVDDVDRELGRLRAAGFEARSDILDFQGRRLAFVRGPEDVTIELSERYGRS
jgi:catechol 2,3-dioxygenase-like lactoylglutathione lyase family enzyme